jgi:hypothetical protein
MCLTLPPQMKAVQKFKHLILKKRPDRMEGILGGSARMVQPPERIDLAKSPPEMHQSRSIDSSDRNPAQHAPAVEGTHQTLDLAGTEQELPQRKDSAVVVSDDAPLSDGGKKDGGHAGQSHSNAEAQDDDHTGSTFSDILRPGENIKDSSLIKLLTFF